MTEESTSTHEKRAGRLAEMHERSLADARRERRARLANIRQELIAPVEGIVGFSRLLKDDAQSAEFDAIGPDIAKIEQAALDLSRMAEQLLDVESSQALFEGKEVSEVQRTLRHDMRVPLNAIKGFAELVLDDLGEDAPQPIKLDFDKLLNAIGDLLERIDTIIDFSYVGTDVRFLDTESLAAMASNIASTMRPLSAQEVVTQSGRVLVVDDIEMNRDLIERQLSREGHIVTVAESGENALKIAAESEFDVILSDLMMPGMNGFELLQRLKGDDRTRDVPVIMISALDEMDSVVRCVAAGAEDYINKPFDPVLLKARISRSLEKKLLRDREHLYLEQLEVEKGKFERLLANILPRQVIERLNGGETIIADRFDEVSVLLADIVGFTEISGLLPAQVLVENLNQLYTRFDELAWKFGVEKVKMIGDSYMVVAGLPEPRTDHAEATARMALAMMEIVDGLSWGDVETLSMRVGIHTGPVIAGIIGTHRFLYDVWGDTVNVASRLEASSAPSRIHVSSVTRGALGDAFELEPRGLVALKGKGEIETFFLNAGPKRV